MFEKHSANRGEITVPVVSVLMPVFNRENLVGDAIQSILDQTFEDWELIILDDASTDGTLQVCESYAARDGRIRVHKNEKNLGVGGTRNRLLSLASGQYFAIQDSDDISVPERLAWEVEVLESKPEIGLVSGVVAYLDDEGRVIQHFPESLHRSEQYPQDKKAMVRLLYRNCEIANPTCMFRRSLVAETQEAYGTYRFVDDLWFFLHAAHRVLFWGIPKVLAKMRRGTDHIHLWGDYPAGQMEAIQVKEAVYRLYKKDPESPINYWLYRKGMSALLVWQGRFNGSWHGYFTILRAISYDLSNRRAWESLWAFSARALRKALRFALRSPDPALQRPPANRVQDRRR
jgi:glycosyltransferase involved in cell wall biosynthesis